jgi:TolB-like protein
MTVQQSTSARHPEAEVCRRQLHRILESQDFDASERDRRFLSYVVDEALSGGADRIKAYTIAIEVFGRDASFDPQTDPIVRVEAGHLRRALDRYYRSGGRNDPVIITIPTGGYAPTFERRAVGAETPVVARGAAAASLRPHPRKVMVVGLVVLAFLAGAGLASIFQLRRAGPVVPDVPRLEVVPLQERGANEAASELADGLTSEIVAEVARFRDIVVVAPTEGVSERAPRYILDGSLAPDGNEVRIQLRLRRREDGAVIWAESYSVDLSMERRLLAQARIASQVATAIGQPYGAIFQADAMARAGISADPGDPYACTLAYFDFRATFDTEGYRTVRACLETAVSQFPDYATAWGLLAQIHVDGLRFGFASDVPVEQVLAEARRALILEPTNVRALQAKMTGLALAGDRAGAIRVGAGAAAINPNDTELLGEYGFRVALSGRWEEGCTIMQSAIERNPGPLAYYETGLALCAYIAGRYDEAADRIRAAALPQVALFHLIAAALFAEAGQIEEAHRERDWLMENGAELLRNLPSAVALRVGRPEDSRKFLNSLERAGITSADVSGSISR